MTELSLTDDAARRRLERLADRLRVVGPRLAAREGEPAQELLTRIRAGLQRIADLAADADGEPRRRVPDLAAHALGDQALVLGLDLLGPVPEQVHPSAGPDRAADERRIAAGRAFAEISVLI
jgi:hypothetical protein